MSHKYAVKSIEYEEYFRSHAGKMQIWTDSHKHARIWPSQEEAEWEASKIIRNGGGACKVVKYE